MNYRLSFLCVVICVLLFSNGIYSQEKTPVKPVDSDKEETPQTQPQTQPSKMYDLKPLYKKNMKWKEKVTIVSKNESSYYSNTTNISLTSDVEVSEMKEDKPTSIKFIKFKGKMESEGEDYSDSDELDETSFTATLDENYCIKSLDNSDPNRDESYFLMLYPTGNLPGIQPPSKAVKVGESWKSDKLIALNFKVLFDAFGEEMKVSNNTGEFKLTSVEEKDKVEIGNISWIGKCTIQAPMGEEGNLEVKWNVTIKFDLTNRRLISTDASITANVSGTDESTMNLTIKRTLEYEKTEKKEEKPNIGPKTDDE